MSEQNTNGKYISPFIKGTEPREATIPATPFWSAVKIRFRPMSADEESIVLSKFRIGEQAGIPTSWVACHAEAFGGTREAKGNLLDWDVKDENGHRINVTQENICSVHPDFFNALYAILLGRMPAAPESTETQREAEVKNSAAA